MPGEYDDTSRNEGGDFEDVSHTEYQADRPRADRINRKRLENLSGNGKVLQIFYRDGKNGTMVQCKDLNNIPREVAGICSDLVDKTCIMKGTTFFSLPETREEEGPISIEAYKFVFEWIQKCGQEQKEVGIKDDHPLPEPQSDKLTTDVFTPIIDILRAADKLRVPHDSFGKFVLKQMLPLARKYLIPLDLVKKIYDNGGTFPKHPELREVAWSSIYEAWYMYRLDAEEFDDFMEELGELRRQLTELDEDLKQATDKKDEFLRAARERKRVRDAENNTSEEFGTSTIEAFGGYHGDDGNAGRARDENGHVESQDWTQGNDDTTTNEWNGAGTDHVNGGGGGSGVNWAEEMNEDHQLSSGFDVIAPAPATAW